MSVHEYSMFVFTWNLAGRKPDKDVNYAHVFKSENLQNPPDLAVIGFQEIITLNMWNIFNKLRGK